MKKISKLFVVLSLSVLSIFILPACGLVDGLLEKAGYTKVDPVDQTIENSTQATIEATSEVPSELPSSGFVFNGSGDPELAAEANEFLTTLSIGDGTAGINMLRYYQGSFGDDPYAWMNWLSAHRFESWTIETANWDGQGWGCVTGVATTDSTTFNYSLIYQQIYEENTSLTMITDMYFIEP